MLFGVQSTNNVFTLCFTANPVLYSPGFEVSRNTFLKSVIFIGHGTATSKALQMVRQHMIPHTLTSPDLKYKRNNAERVLFLLTDGENFNVLYYQLLV